MLYKWSGREDYCAYASFTAAIGKADRRLFIRLCLVVEPPSSEVQTHILKFRYKKTAVKAVFYIWSGREDYCAYASFTAAIGKADRRLFIRLCLVVEPPSSEVRTHIPKFRYKKTAIKAVFLYLVGTRGFEPPTSCTPCKRSTRLNYVPFKQQHHNFF